MDDLDILKAELDDPKNAEAISVLEKDMMAYVLAKRKKILGYHAQHFPQRKDLDSYSYAIMQHFVVEDRCSLNQFTELRIQLGRAMRETWKKLRRREEFAIDDFVIACLQERGIDKVKEFLNQYNLEVTQCMGEQAVEWRDDFMITVAMLFERKKVHYVGLLLYDAGLSPSAALSLPLP